jgi:hypothetical protein
VLLAGVGTFVAVGVAGLSVIERYLAAGALAVLVFAAVPLGGWALLAPGRLRRWWAVAALVAGVAGAAATAARVDLGRLGDELRFRGAAHASLVDVLGSPRVRDALRCGPLTVPNHKLVPDARWIADLPAGRVLARATRHGMGARRGVALVVTSRFAIFRHAWTDPRDPATIQLPPAGFERVAVSDHVAAYARC